MLNRQIYMYRRSREGDLRALLLWSHVRAYWWYNCTNHNQYAHQICKREQARVCGWTCSLCYLLAVTNELLHFSRRFVICAYRVHVLRVCWVTLYIFTTGYSTYIINLWSPGLSRLRHVETTFLYSRGQRIRHKRSRENACSEVL